MPPTTPPTRQAGQTGLRALLVENEPEGLSGLGSALSRLGETGIQVELAMDLERALERLSRGGIDVLLLDLDLPDSEDMGTFERVHGFAPDVPIVVLTRVEDEEMALSMVKAGAQDYLVKKEATPELLVRSIRYAVERHRLTSALRSLSLIDDLTGLYNRRGFSELGEQHLLLARRTARAVLLVYLDVDDLKTINDTLGHHVGDRALLRLAEILRACFRSSDLMARLGGDAFAVLAPEAAAEPLEVFVRRVKRAVDGFNRNSRDSYRLSVSIGATRYDGSAVVRLDDLLARADSAMYEEKRAKRKAVLP